MRTRLLLPWLASAALATALVAPAAAQTPPTAPQAPRTIRVSAVGEVQVTPDQAALDLAVETLASTARAAGEENARRMERVIQALVAAGVPRADIATRNYSIYPEYEPVEGGEAPRVRGYRVNNTVSVETRDLARVGPLIDAALAAGANRVDGVRFSLSNPQAAGNRALRQAVEQARASAETMAAALGVRLGRVLDASTGVEPPVFPMPRFEAADMAMRAAAPTPIQPGEQTVRATATLVFEILR